MNIDLNGNGNHNSVNITVDFQYVNTWTKYNANAILRLRENSTGDWQYNVVGINQSVLSFKKITTNVFEVWGYSNGGWGHLSFTTLVTKEAPLIITIPDLPIESSNIDSLEDVPVKGDWYFPLGKIEIIKGGTIASKWNPAGSYFTLSGTDGSKLIMDTNEIYGLSTLYIGSKSGDLVKFRSVQDNGPASDKMVIKNDGKVGIGTMSPDAKLTVKGNIHAEEVKIDLSVPAPDYVFTKDYDLLTIEEVQEHIAAQGHLPNIPSATEMETNGVELGLMNMKLLEKIEELTLYTIAQEKQLKGQKEEIKALKKQNDRINQLEEKLEALLNKK
ncbi:tail fiber protein [Aquimarina sp. MMG016]|uniref:tail fiber protein n=1 Tax=Aquimarina sp. MMG016 TaxID=2822690 RepID=UPI001B3A654E|nr:tail fiber protein [Aquimarina sp. MMG016]MBQ4822476.1 hypothetical protein [Aquimarina sp. MMG016]